MTEEVYDLLPHQLLSDLRYDVEALKKKLIQPDTKVNELILEIESLKDSIHELTTIFQKTLEQTQEEDPSIMLKTLKEKMDTVLSQNETVAKGMIAISDKVDNFMRSGSLPKQEMRTLSYPPYSGPPPQKHVIGAPSMPGIARVAPTPLETPASMGTPSEFPPPPMPGKKRTGLFQ